MRIAIFTDTYTPEFNGVVQSIDRFTKLLADDGHKIMIFCPKNGRYKDKEYPNIEMRRYSSVTFPSYKDVRVALPFILGVVSDLREFKPDIVHIQTPMGIGWIAIWATKILKLKNVQTYHTYIPDFILYLKPKSLFGFKKIVNFVATSYVMRALLEEDISEKEEGNGRLKQYLQAKLDEVTQKANADTKGVMMERFAWEYTRAIYNRANMVLTPSKALQKALTKHGVKHGVHVLSNGIDYNFFEKREDYTIHNRLVHVGRLGYEKHLEVAIQAIKIALGTNPNITLDVIGDGPAKKSWEQLTKQLQISKNVRFLGFIKREELFKKYCEYDAFITASTIETQGIVLLEAMAAGLPVIAVKELAVPEIVINNKNGYLSKSFDEQSMAQNIVNLFSDEKKINNFGLYSLKIAKHHEITKCKDRLVGYYKRLL